MAKKKSPGYESYIASSRRAAKRRGKAAAVSPYTIEVRFLGGLTTAQKNAFKTAADRWTKVIVGDLPSVQVDGEVIDDLLILAQGVAIDGPGGILGQAGPTHVRPPAAGTAAFLPVKGIMSFDTADLAKMQSKGTLNPRFTGKTAKTEFGKLKGKPAAEVPVENTGGPGTQDGHWRESVFRNELMSGFIAAPNNPLSRMTVGSLQDMGYTVDLAKAEEYKLPDLLALAAAGSKTTHDQPHAIPVIPITLPDSSLLK
jgi:hypothetical protein